MSDTVSTDEFKDLALIKALDNPSVKYIRQQGWDPLTRALGYKPKGHVCGRFAGNRRLPIQLDTVRQDPEWRTKITNILADANSAKHRKQAISTIYKCIIQDIWVPQAIAILQRRFLQWNYLPGNPGYRRRIITYNKRIYKSQMYSKKTSRISKLWIWNLCCVTRKSSKDTTKEYIEEHYTDNDSSGEWSD